MRQMARIFLMIIESRFAGGPFFFPGFGRGASIPDMISAGYLPVLVMVFSSIAIPLCILEVHILHILHLVTAIILKIIISTAVI